MTTLKEHCIFTHPHEQPCLFGIDDIKKWLEAKLNDRNFKRARRFASYRMDTEAILVTDTISRVYKELLMELE